MNKYFRKIDFHAYYAMQSNWINEREIWILFMTARVKNKSITVHFFISLATTTYIAQYESK